MKPELIRESVRSLKEREKELIGQLTLVQGTIKSIQQICPHKNEYALGHGHNDELFQCQDCQREVWR